MVPPEAPLELRGGSLSDESGRLELEIVSAGPDMINPPIGRMFGLEVAARSTTWRRSNRKKLLRWSLLACILRLTDREMQFLRLIGISLLIQLSLVDSLSKPEKLRIMSSTL